MSPSLVLMTATSLLLHSFFFFLWSCLLLFGFFLVSFLGSSARATISPTATLSAQNDMNAFISPGSLPPAAGEVTLEIADFSVTNFLANRLVFS